MRVLIACEYSGAVRDAFSLKGHEAISCDLLPSDKHGKHYKGDLFDLIDFPFDFGGFHLPCTDLSVSGARHFEAKKTGWAILCGCIRVAESMEAIEAYTLWVF